MKPGVDPDAFYTRLAAASERVLMLDYDGTLAPFHERPECAVPYAGVPALLARIMGTPATRVVIVSGRPAAELPPLLGVPALPEIWGGHGRERVYPDGRTQIAEPDARVRAALAQAAADVRALMPAAARLECKLASIALHWRGLPEAQVAHLRDTASALLGEAARTSALELLPFDGGLELRASGCSKASAVDAILGESGADAVVAYLGDDITDEDAFRAVQPRGLAVLVRPELRSTCADLWLQPPHELIAFLEHWQGDRP